MTLNHEEEVIALVTEFFIKEPHKVDIWMESSNVHLGGVSPNQMLKFGRGKNLLKWMKHTLDENC